MLMTLSARRAAHRLKYSAIFCTNVLRYFFETRLCTLSAPHVGAQLHASVKFEARRIPALPGEVVHKYNFQVPHWY